MKRWMCLLIVVLIALTSSSALAHSGGTDSSGGHTNHSTGEYHYHHGYPEHQHYGGVCPYEDNDSADYSWEPGTDRYTNFRVSSGNSAVWNAKETEEEIKELKKELSSAEKQIQEQKDSIDRHRKYRAWQEDYIATLWVILGITLVVLFFFIVGYARAKKRLNQ